ncbi:hypothetical protein EWM64_g3985 [Hericium alpestre]|uniref:WHIM1 domain-containing protein n=1 Tax=Hericium alpestre TaxID=135208 RepID=A0A4Z0A0S6_9AGAM|nr:hypothetical protein EWM64_g3985 [Hericium alpestre]
MPAAKNGKTTKLPAEHIVDKKAHICPPSDATHPKDRWESLFVYAFICKFTELRSKVEGLESPMDFEEALLAHEPHPIMTQILTRFVLNLRPQTRNISPDQISSTVYAVLLDAFKTPERSVFWDEDLGKNVDPFEGMDGGFFSADWDLKLKVLRQLVEMQLTHSPAIKNLIDRAWGVVHNKHKKKEAPDPPPLDPSDPFSMESLAFNPLGQDYSPRVYISSNPWKITSTFQSMTSTRDEYVALLQVTKEDSAPEPKEGEKRTRPELAHIALVKVMEARLEVIDNELARVQKLRKKIEQRAILMAQAEIRQTRTRRQTRRPDYVYYEGGESEEEKDDEDTYHDDGADEGQQDDDEFSDARSGSAGPSGRRGVITTERRRSTRAAVVNGNGKRASAPDPWTQWRGERRSTRLGAPLDTQIDDPPPKRARTEDSMLSANSEEHQSSGSGQAALKVKQTGAAAVRPTEIAMEQVGKRKKSKFWYYAVEPIPGSSAPALPVPSNGTTAYEESSSAGHGHTTPAESEAPTSSQAGDSGLAPALEGSLSPVPGAEVS